MSIPPPPHAHTDSGGRPPGAGLSLASMIIGIVALVTCVLGVLAGPAAIVLGVLGGRRHRFGAAAVTGIVTGAVAFLASAGMWFLIAVGALTSWAESSDLPDDGTAAPATQAAQDDVTFTEQGIAASDYAHAYEAWVAIEGTTDAYSGIYLGDEIVTDCFRMDGEVWWVGGSENQAPCEAVSELWWETGGPDGHIRLFGSGGVGAAITVEAVTPATLESIGASDLDTLVDYIVTEFLPGELTVLSHAPTTIGGTPAYVIECEAAGLEHYRYYVLEAPRAYAEADGAQHFVVHVYNEAEWVYPWDAVTARFEQTFAWQ